MVRFTPFYLALPVVILLTGSPHAQIGPGADPTVNGVFGPTAPTGSGIETGAVPTPSARSINPAQASGISRTDQIIALLEQAKLNAPAATSALISQAETILLQPGGR